MRRIISVLAVAALMAAMLVAMAAPAMATKLLPREAGSCGEKGLPLVPGGGLDFLTFPNNSQGDGHKGHICPPPEPEE